MAPYRLLITTDVLRLPKTRGVPRERLLAFLDRLAGDPFARGDYEERDDVGRPVQIKVIGNLALTFWADHAVKEIKVVRIEPADRR